MLPEEPKDFAKHAFDLESAEIDAFDYKSAMEDFIEALTNKNESALLPKDYLVLGERLGGGKESEVFKSNWLGTDVAVKYFKYASSSPAAEPIPSAVLEENATDNINSFSNEVAILMGLQHRNIIMCMGFGVQNPTQFIVMEYMPRGSLFDLLGSQEKIDSPMKLRMVNDAIEGLMYLHESKPAIIHQDLKSLNLLVDSDFTIKIADFGIAKVLMEKRKKVQDFPEEEETETHAGTLQWLAPECILDDSLSTKEMDIFAFGVILWELATRRRPWKSVKRKVICESVIGGQRPQIRDEDAWNPGFRSLVEKCWNQDPKKRPAFKTLKKSLKDLIIP